MKQIIRIGVFETNSSSTHSLTIMPEKEYERWTDENLLFNECNEFFVNEEEAIQQLRKDWEENKEDENYQSLEDYMEENSYTIYDVLRDEQSLYTFEGFFEQEYYETYERRFTTPNGDKMIAFGYYGYGG